MSTIEAIKLEIKGQEQNTYAIHYSCSGFYNGGVIAPTICAVVLTNLNNGEIHTFALHNYILKGKCLIDAEKELLNDFSKFLNGLDNPILIHWKMDEAEFGFKALTARCENFGIYNLSFTKIKTIDLNSYIYVPIVFALKVSNCSCAYLLKGKEEAMYFDKRNYNAVMLSTQAKSYGMVKLLKLALNGKFDLKILENLEY